MAEHIGDIKEILALLLAPIVDYKPPSPNG
jgi:hypothetical protein